MIQFSLGAIVLASLSVLSLTACTTTATQPLSTSSSAPVSKPSLEVASPEAAVSPTPQADYLNERCQPASAGNWKVLTQSPFSANGRAYGLSLITTRDVGDDRKLCLSQPNFKQAKELRIINTGFIDQITPDPNRPASFQVKAHEGNGIGVPSEYYQLDLSNPSQPQLTLLKFAFDPRPTASGADADNSSRRPNAVIFSTGQWWIAVGSLLSWKGENNTGNLFYRGCDSRGNCISLENGTAAQLNGVFTASWGNGDTSYVLSMPNSTTGQAEPPATLVIARGQQEILRLTNLKRTAISYW